MTEYKSKVKYEAPIEINIEEDFPDSGSMAVSEIENMICSAVLKVGITVDKEELIKALRYDRGQYEKGYADGKRDAAAAIEALQADVKRLQDKLCDWCAVCPKERRRPEDCELLSETPVMYGPSDAAKMEVQE